MFNDEELSRILSAHCTGELRQAGMYSYPDARPQKVCVLQAAYGFEEETPTNTYNFDGDIAGRFDAEYNPGWPMGKFVRWLTANGLA